MPESLKQPSDSQIRLELQDLILSDLLGPAGGPSEEIEEDSVRSRYIVGMLAPHGQTEVHPIKWTGS